MADAMIMRRGGGAGVKLKLTTYAAAGLLPASADDGAVAVITTTPIGSITLDATQPTTAATGDLWLKIGFLGRAAVQLYAKPLVKNYPFTAMQYFSGAWAFVRVFVYHGAWLELRAWLYDMGNNHTENGSNWAVDYLEAGYGTITFGASAVAMTRTVSGSGVQIKKSDLIDLTQFSTLKVLMKKLSSASSGQARVTILDGSTTVATVTASSWAQNEIRTVSLDVSAINALRKIRVEIMDTSNFEMQQAWLE